MFKFSEAEFYALLAINIMQHRDTIRSKEQLLETCRMLRDEVKVDGGIRGFCYIIQAILSDSFTDEIESMLINYDNANNASYRLLATLHEEITSGSLSKDELLQNTADTLLMEGLKIYNGDKEEFTDMLHILTDKIEMIGAE